jgi:hypothetical protein
MILSGKLASYIRGFYCMAVVFFMICACKDVNAVNDLNFLTFCSRLHTTSCLTPVEWQRSFGLIRGNVSEIKPEDAVNYLTIVGAAVQDFCASTFQSFVDFCLSPYCDDEARDTVLTLLSVCCRGIEGLRLDHTSKLCKELDSFIQGNLKRGCFLFSDGDTELFFDLYQVLDEYLYKDGCC